MFAWELGGDYGHLSRLLPVARELVNRGHSVVFAVRDLMGAEILLTPHGMRAFQAPLWLGSVTNLPESISYAEMLMRFGYLNAPALTGICRAWRNLVDVVAPDLLVLDHAPTALLATRGLGVPRMNFGDGFCIPPATRPMPHFRWWQRENMTRLVDSEQHALATANQVLLALGVAPMLCLADLMSCNSSLFCTFAELDHYPERANQDCVGPIFSLGQGAQVVWPQDSPPKIFAYLKAGYGGLDNVLTALHGSNASVLAHVPGASRKTIQQFSSPRMAFSSAPLDMAQVSASCDLAVCHGGGGTTAALLLAGKPLMLLPMHMEQVMTARRLAALGVAVTLVPEATAQMPRQLKKVLADESFIASARNFAARHVDYSQTNTIALAADRCESLISKTP